MAVMAHWHYHGNCDLNLVTLYQMLQNLRSNRLKNATLQLQSDMPTPDSVDNARYYAI